MLDYILQNFNWVTFFLALAFFILVSNVFNLIISYIRMIRAKQRAKEAEAELSRLRGQLKEKDKDLENISVTKRGK